MSLRGSRIATLVVSDERSYDRPADRTPAPYRTTTNRSLRRLPTNISHNTTDGPNPYVICAVIAGDVLPTASLIESSHWPADETLPEAPRDHSSVISPSSSEPINMLGRCHIIAAAVLGNECDLRANVCVSLSISTIDLYLTNQARALARLDDNLPGCPRCRRASASRPQRRPQPQSQPQPKQPPWANRSPALADT